jgi:Domain of unknown function (DUF3885)
LGYLLQLQDYLTKRFNGIELSKPLFYKTDIGLRFELGADLKLEEGRMVQVYSRAHALFDFVHQPNDEIFLVVNAHRYCGNDGVEGYDEPTKVFEQYLNRRQLQRVIDCIRLPALYLDGEDNDVWTDRYCLRCKTSDIKVHDLLDAIANLDMGIEPQVEDECYFVNIERGTIFHLYDDRGLDIVASEKHALYDAYLQYNHWILDYDRERIDNIFSKR